MHAARESRRAPSAALPPCRRTAARRCATTAQHCAAWRGGPGRGLENLEKYRIIYNYINFGRRRRRRRARDTAPPRWLTTDELTNMAGQWCPRWPPVTVRRDQGHHRTDTRHPRGRWRTAALAREVLRSRTGATPPACSRSGSNTPSTHHPTVLSNFFSVVALVPPRWQSGLSLGFSSGGRGFKPVSERGGTLFSG